MRYRGRMSALALLASLRAACLVVEGEWEGKLLRVSNVHFSCFGGVNPT